MATYVVSPKTGRRIRVGGPTYTDLSSSPKWRGKLINAEASPSPKTLKSGKKRGCSNQGKYKNVPSDLFCGPEGGSCPGTYPVNTPGRARAAMAYARHAPNPEGIKKCAIRVAKQRGYFKKY